MVDTEVKRRPGSSQNLIARTASSERSDLICAEASRERVCPRWTAVVLLPLRQSCPVATAVDCNPNCPAHMAPHDRPNGSLQEMKMNTATPTPRSGLSTTVSIIRPREFDAATAQTGGAQRLAAVTRSRGIATGLWGGLFSIAPGGRIDVHHHGLQETVAFVLEGRCQLRWGERGNPPTAPRPVTSSISRPGCCIWRSILRLTDPYAGLSCAARWSPSWSTCLGPGTTPPAPNWPR